MEAFLQRRAQGLKKPRVIELDASIIIARNEFHVSAEHQHHQLAVHSPHGRESGLVWLCFPTRCGCTDCTKFLRSFAQLLVHFALKPQKSTYIYICIYCFFWRYLFEIDMFEVFQIFKCSCTGRLPNTSASRNICGNVSTSAGSNAGAYRTGTTSIQVSKAAATSMFRSQGKEWNERN